MKKKKKIFFHHPLRQKQMYFCLVPFSVSAAFVEWEELENAPSDIVLSQSFLMFTVYVSTILKTL